jgi:hypothetical protein
MNTRNVAIPEQSKAHSTKRKHFHLEDFYKDLQMKRNIFLSLDMSLSLTSFLLLKGIMGSSWDLSYLLSLQEAVIMLTGMKMSHRLHMVALFRDGLIELVAILSGRISGMIRIAIVLI